MDVDKYQRLVPRQYCGAVSNVLQRTAGVLVSQRARVVTRSCAVIMMRDFGLDRAEEAPLGASTQGRSASG